jgi:hypothetical protein
MLRGYKKESPPGMMVHICNPSYLESVGRNITVQGWPAQKLEMLSEKQTKSTRNEHVIQMVEH